MYPFDQDLKENIAYQELRVELTPKIGNVKNSLIVGGSYERTSGTLATDFLFTDEENEGIPINYLNPVHPAGVASGSTTCSRLRTYHLGITGLFAQYMIEPAPRWVFTGGGRYDRLALDNQRGRRRRGRADVQRVQPEGERDVQGCSARRPASPPTRQPVRARTRTRFCRRARRAA